MKSFYKLGFCSVLLALGALFYTIIYVEPNLVHTILIMSLDCAILAVGAAILTSKE